MIGTVPNATMIAMAVAAAVSILVPVIYGIIICRKTTGRKINLLVGALTFIAVVLIIESLFHNLIFFITGNALKENIWLYALYGGLAAGIFEETGRLLSMKLFMKKSLTKQSALVYGIGYGGAESLFVGGITYVSNIALSALINSGKFEPMLDQLGDSLKAQTIEQYSVLWTAPASEFLLAGLERVSAFVLQLCLTYIVYRAVKDKKLQLYFAAVAIHFAVDAGLVLLLKAAELPTAVVELILLAATACLAVIVYKKNKAEKEEIPPTPEFTPTENE